ncbi:MAG: helix-turn-helix domain-containing protein [Christensenellales bacterium]|nr:MAG TPA: helix-turn-helix protein [Caudoviricetes sp.]
MLDRVLFLMQQLNINKNQLAKMCDLPRTTIYSALSSEENLQNTKLETLRAIARALQISLDYIIYGKTDDLNNVPSDKIVVTIGRGGERTTYELNDEDVALLDTFLKRLKKDDN